MTIKSIKSCIPLSIQPFQRRSIPYLIQFKPGNKNPGTKPLSGVAITKKLANHDTSILIDLDDRKHQ